MNEELSLDFGPSDVGKRWNMHGL